MRITRSQWLGVAGQEPFQTPSADAGVKAADDVVEAFTLTFPGLELAEITTDEGRFTRIAIPGAGVSAVPGASELPVYRRLLPVDPAGTYSCRAVVLEQQTQDLAKLEAPSLVLPSRRPIPKIPGAREAATLGFDPAQNAQRMGPSEVATLQDLGMMNGRRLLLIEVFPVDLVTTGSTGGTKESIRDHIRAR